METTKIFQNLSYKTQYGSNTWRSRDDFLWRVVNIFISFLSTHSSNSSILRHMQSIIKMMLLTLARSSHMRPLTSAGCVVVAARMVCTSLSGVDEWMSKGLVPHTSSKATTPSDHQSTAKL